jgi:hypothetical protein
MTTEDLTVVALRQLAVNTLAGPRREPEEVAKLLYGAASYIETMAALLDDAQTDLEATNELIDRIREVVCGN